MGYMVLEKDTAPESLNAKPGWIACATFVAGILMVTLSAVAVGAFIGYTYCYIEHRTGLSTDQLGESANIQLIHLPLVESEEVKNNRTINGALMSSALVSRILRVGHALIEEDLPWTNDDPALPPVTTF